MRLYQSHGCTVVPGTLAFGLQTFGDLCGYGYIAKGTAALLVIIALLDRLAAADDGQSPRCGDRA